MSFAPAPPSTAPPTSPTPTTSAPTSARPTSFGCAGSTGFATTLLFSLHLRTVVSMHLFNHWLDALLLLEGQGGSQGLTQGGSPRSRRCLPDDELLPIHAVNLQPNPESSTLGWGLRCTSGSVQPLKEGGNAHLGVIAFGKGGGKGAKSVSRLAGKTLPTTAAKGIRLQDWYCLTRLFTMSPAEKASAALAMICSKQLMFSYSIRLYAVQAEHVGLHMVETQTHLHTHLVIGGDNRAVIEVVLLYEEGDEVHVLENQQQTHLLMMLAELVLPIPGGPLSKIAFLDMSLGLPPPRPFASPGCSCFRNVRSVATRVPLPTSSAELVGLCFSTHSCPPALAPPPLLLGPAEAAEDRAPVRGQYQALSKLARL
ncbi:MAG: hypothetical protein FRX49_02532 [Trebouxia sp. A1-2]|nr:MAG: hypothetical protein FRX49_02532 [Trebouxia sp. A1-2]